MNIYLRGRCAYRGMAVCYRVNCEVWSVVHRDGALMWSVTCYSHMCSAWSKVRVVYLNPFTPFFKAISTQPGTTSRHEHNCTNKSHFEALKSIHREYRNMLIIRNFAPPQRNTSCLCVHLHLGLLYVHWPVWIVTVCVPSGSITPIYCHPPPTPHVSLLCPRGLKTTADKTLLHHPLYKSSPMLAVWPSSLSFCHLSCVNIFCHLCSAF